MKIQFFSLLLALIFCSCGNDPATSSATENSEATTFSAAELAAQTEAYESMMEMHDRVMPKMGSIAQMQKMLKEKMADADAEAQGEMEDAYNRLEKAYDGMMNWMKDMKSMDDLRAMDGQDAVMAYVKKETASMNEIEEMLQSGMERSYKLLGIDPAEMETKTDGHNHDHSGHDHDHGDHDH